ncbi:hypothetical protein [Deinococcus aquaedulcis]|uniref:hypothetical protein n=1 Tax=Deinococcus aquaedulcis TaxID=2840455 RepID=UPI001C833C6E|nr:hypothetical protein [Deinococcus aquaedulcis]
MSHSSARPGRSPEIEARAEAMRQQRQRLAQRLRTSRQHLQFYGAAEQARDFLQRYRAVTERYGHLTPNPDRAAACAHFSQRTRALATDLAQGLHRASDPAAAQAIVQALNDEADFYETLARTAFY